jgi:peptidyl-prolyl cis-trans isomerase D
VLQAVVVRVVDHREGSAKPLAEVREEIVGVLRKERAQKAAAAAATAGADKLRGGADWAAVAGEDKVEGPALVGRNDPKVPAPVRTAAFTLAPPAPGAANVGTATLEDGDAAILRVTKVEDGKVEAPAKGAADPAAMLGQLLGRQTYDAVVKDMEGRAKIERTPAVVREGG